MALPARLLRPRASGAGFDPRSLANLEAWWDFSDSSTLFSDDAATTLTAADGQIAVCKDKSGLGRDLTQTTANNRPLRKLSFQGGRDAADFDGSNDTLKVASSTAIFKFLHSADSTVLFTFKPGVVANPNAPYAVVNTYQLSYADADGPGGSQGFTAAYWDAGGLNDSLRCLVANAGANYIVIHTANDFAPAQTWGVASLVTRPTNATAANRSVIRNKNSTQATNTATGAVSTANAATSLEVGVWRQSNQYSRIAVGEIAIYSRALSDAEESAARLYLLAKWGL